MVVDKFIDINVIDHRPRKQSAERVIAFYMACL